VCAVSSTHAPDRKTPIALGVGAPPPVPDEELVDVLPPVPEELEDAAPEDVELAIPPLLEVPLPLEALLVLVVDVAPVEELDVAPPPWPPVPVATHPDDVSVQLPFAPAQPAS
jgi:hypothetical protein